MSANPALQKIIRERRKRGTVDLGKCCEIAIKLTGNDAVRKGLEEAAQRLAGIEYQTNSAPLHLRGREGRG